MGLAVARKAGRQRVVWCANRWGYAIPKADEGLIAKELGSPLHLMANALTQNEHHETCDGKARQGPVHSFLALRRAVGFVGIALPFALLLLHGGVLESVSAGYYTSGSAMFVAGVCGIGIFLLFYRGYDARDRVASFVAGAAALVVGQVPCGSSKIATGDLAWGWGANFAASVWPVVRLLAAAVLFVVLALFCLWLFPMSDEPSHANRKKVQRNFIYYSCGAVIVTCLGMLLAHFAFKTWMGAGGVFWLETAMLLAFGLSWTVKGEGIGLLNDRGVAALASARGPSGRAQSRWIT